MKPAPSLYLLASEISGQHGLSLDELREPNRNRSMYRIRQEVAIALRNAGASYPECGLVLNRDHTSVMHMVRTAAPLRSGVRHRIGEVA